MLKTVDSIGLGGKGWGSAVEEGLRWLKHNACAGIIPRQKSHWTLNRHLNNEGQVWQTNHDKERVLTGEGGEKKERRWICKNECQFFFIIVELRVHYDIYNRSYNIS
jgi:hypothetical protein